MQIKMDPRSLAADGVQTSAPIQSATDGRGAGKISVKSTDSIVQAEFGKSRDTATTGTYAEEVARQLDINEVSKDTDVLDPVNFISQCMTGEDARDLSDDKTPLEEYTSSQLERAIVRVRDQRQDRMDSVEQQADRQRQIEADIREKSEDIAADARLLSQVASALAGSDLPITENNISDLADAAGKVSGVQSFGDSALKFMMTNESKVTPDSIQDSLYGSGTVMVGKGEAARVADAYEKSSLLAVPDDRQDGFDEVSAQIEERLLEAGLSADESEMSTARWLYQNDLPVTSDNISNIDTVRALRDMDDETLLARLVSEMEDGVLADGADLSHMSKDEIADLVERLVSTDEKTLRQAYPSEAGLATARRQLEEIRVQMTIESAREMSKLGVKIDIDNLQGMVDKLREFEQEAFASLIGETSLEPTVANISLLSDTVSAADTVLAAPVELLSYTYDSRDTVTLESLSEQGSALARGYEDGSAVVQRDVFRSLEQTYEAVGTQVRSDLGDSIRKAFGNMGSMLAELGLPDTAANERAVRILGYNQMEITVESVIEMKIYDNQVNNLMQSMRPQVVQKMVEEGVNPLELSLSELEREVNRISSQVSTEDVTFAKFLWKLDKQGDISAEERESMIGIYRLLDKIEKSDGAVIGQLVNEGRDLSLKNMLEAVRTRKHGGVDAAIDDDFGEIASVKGASNAIDAQIMSAYIASEAHSLKTSLSPQALKQYASQIEDSSLDELADICERAGETEDDMAPYFEEMAESVRETVTEADESVYQFLEELELPQTIGNIAAATDYVRGNMRGVRSLWEKSESDSVVEAFDEPDELDTTYENIENSHKSRLENIKESDDISFEDVTEAIQMAGHIAFYQAARRFRTYEVPLITDRGVLDCSVTLRDGKSSEKGTVDITVNSDTLGRLQATFKLSGMRVSGFVTVENEQSTEYYREMLDGFEKDLEESGFTMDGNSLITGNRNSLHVGDSVQDATNQDLYRIAKCFLQRVNS